MLPFGSKRTYGDCIVTKCRNGGKVHIRLGAVNKAAGRRLSKSDRIIHQLEDIPSDDKEFDVFYPYELLEEVPMLTD